MARINFSVQGLASGTRLRAAREQILRELADRHFHPAFDSGSETFSVVIDPGVHSFSDVRRAIGALGKRKGLVYLAVVMSP